MHPWRITHQFISPLELCRFEDEKSSAASFSLPDTERGKDAVQDVVCRCRSGDGVDGPEGGVKIQQQHFMGDLELHGPARIL